MQQMAARLARWEWLILMGFLPLLMFASRTNGFVLLLIPLLAMVRRMANGRFFPNTPLNLPLLILLLMTLVSLLITFDVATSLPLVSRIVVGVGLYWGCVSSMQRSETAVWEVTGAVLLLGGGLALLGVLTLNWTAVFGPMATVVSMLPASFVGIFQRLVGDTNPNILAQTLLLFTPMLVALGVSGLQKRAIDPKGRSSWLLLLLALGAIMLIFLTRSRGGLLGISMAMICMLAVATRWGRWLLATTVFVLPVTVAAYAPARTFLLSSSASDFNLSSRLEIWSRALFAIADFPLTGLSLNGFSQLVHLLYPLFTISPASPVDHAHNHLLQAGLDFGLPGLVAYLAIWLLVGLLLWQAWQAEKNGRYRLLVLGLIGSQTAVWTFGVFDAAPWIALPGFLWWLLLALVVSVTHHP